MLINLHLPIAYCAVLFGLQAMEARQILWLLLPMVCFADQIAHHQEDSISQEITLIRTVNYIVLLKKFADQIFVLLVR